MAQLRCTSKVFLRIFVYVYYARRSVFHTFLSYVRLFDVYSSKVFIIADMAPCVLLYEQSAIMNQRTVTTPITLSENAEDIPYDLYRDEALVISENT
jgi:hypothetical protein